MLCANVKLAALVNEWYIDGTHFLLVGQTLHIHMIAPMWRKTHTEKGYVCSKNNNIQIACIHAILTPILHEKCLQSIRVNALLTLHPPPTQDAFYEQSVDGAAPTVHTRTTRWRVESSEYFGRTVVEQQLVAFQTPHVAQHLFWFSCNVKERF